MIVIGLTGKKGSGKDTTATLLKQELERTGSYHYNYNVFIRSFGDALREEVAEMLGNVHHNDWIHKGLDSNLYKSNLLEMFNDPEKKLPYRLLLQWWGTEFRRDMFDRNYWVNCVRDYVSSNQFHPNPVFIIPDVRFQNELEFIHSFETNYMIRVDRMVAKTNDAHRSETEMEGLTLRQGHDYCISNNSTKEALQEVVEAIVTQITTGQYANQQ